MYEQLRSIMTQMHTMAQQNLKVHGYLEKVLIAVTEKGPIINNLQWHDDATREKVINNCITSMAQMKCQMYVMIGEASVKEISPEGMKSLDCILVSGEAKDGTVLAIMTPYIKENDIIQFGETEWIDKKEQLGSFAQMNMFKGIFG